MEFDDKPRQVNPAGQFVVYGCVTLIFCLVLFQACEKVNQRFGWENDNAAEQFLEQVIEDQVPIDIDLTPAE